MTSPMVKLTRHVVGIIVVAGVLTVYLGGVDGPATTWAMAAGFPLLVGAVVAALAALFFTRTQAAQWTRNLANVAWVALLLLVLGGWVDGYGTGPRPTQTGNVFDQFDTK